MKILTLDKIDKRLLSYIFHNFRKPITQIAKKCQISREQAEYRMKKYEKFGLIKYFTMFNLHMLGYSEMYNLKLRVKNPNSKNLNQLPENKNILTFTRLNCYGQWDFMITIFAKTKLDFLNFISELYNLWKNEILDYDVFEPIELHFFPLKIFGKRTDDKTLSFEKTEKIEFDELDKKIMQTLSNNANIKIIDLAKKIKEKIETVNYRLKRLEKKVIAGYRIFLNLEIIGYNLASMSIKLNNLSEKIISKIREYAKERERIHASSIGIGKFNTVFQIIYKTPEELSEEINKIKEIFSEELLGYELVQIEKELMPKVIP